MNSLDLGAYHVNRTGLAGTALAALAALALGLPQAATARPVTYTQYVFGTTATATSQVGLGSHVFTGPNTTTSVTFTFVGDTDNVRPYTINRTSGYIIDQGVATVDLYHFVGNDVFTYHATFLPGEIYVGTDQGIPGENGGGYGFGSRIYPIYPYAMFAEFGQDMTDPLYDLQHEFTYFYYAMSCVSIRSSCLNRDPAFTSANYRLQTDQGDFWVTWQGITYALFNVTLGAETVPEPSSLALLGAAAVGLGATRRRRRSLTA